jgi:hypothetical protein
VPSADSPTNRRSSISANPAGTVSIPRVNRSALLTGTTTGPHRSNQPSNRSSFDSSIRNHRFSRRYSRPPRSATLKSAYCPSVAPATATASTGTSASPPSKRSDPGTMSSLGMKYISIAPSRTNTPKSAT